MMKRKAAARRGRPPGVDKGAHPLMFIPALAACTAKRMKSCAFPSLHPMLAAPKAQAEDEKNSQKRTCRFCETKKSPPHGGTVLTPAEAKFRGGGAAPLLV